jgi:formate hydrogenlyase subunit 6/NADH:ubiquinone oxidoreductase subunit I
MEIFSTIMRSLVGTPACKMYPSREPVLYENTRGHISIDPAKCILCTLCAKRCPTGALTVDRESKTWRIDRLTCITCGLCVEVCPKNALSMQNTHSKPVTRKTTETFDIPFEHDKKQP